MKKALKQIRVEAECHPGVTISGIYHQGDISPYTGRSSDGHVDIDSLIIEGDPDDIQEFTHNTDYNSTDPDKKFACRESWAQLLTDRHENDEEDDTYDRDI